MKLKFLGILATSLNCILASVLTAQEPQMFRYQGRILDNDALVSGNLDFSFKLYDTPTGGTSLYEDAATITVVDGLYSTMIGDDSTSGGDLGDALNNPAVYLEIEVGGETLTPRERIVSVPYAMNGLPSGSVILSASNPNAALEAKGYSLVYSDVNSPEDWIVALEDELVVPADSDSMVNTQMEMVTFGSYVGFYNGMGGSTPEELNPFYYSQDGIIWNESELPFNISGGAGAGGESVELNASLYIVKNTAVPTSGGPPLRVATTSNGADFTELSVSLPVSNISSFNLEVWANQIWLFGSSDTGALVLKSSDGATWDEVATPAWQMPSIPGSLNTLSTPDRLVALAPASDSAMDIYVWSTTDGSTWTQSSEIIPSGGSAYTNDVQMAYANGALWTFGSLEGEMYLALYKSTDWGNSWSQVTTDLPNIQNATYELISLAPSSGLMYGIGGGASNTTGTFISEDGSDWIKVASDNLFYSSYPGASSDNLSLSSTGNVWLYYSNYDATMQHQLYSIGGPLRNGRFFYYQKD